MEEAGAGNVSLQTQQNSCGQSNMSVHPSHTFQYPARQNDKCPIIQPVKQDQQVVTFSYQHNWVLSLPPLLLCISVVVS